MISWSVKRRTKSDKRMGKREEKEGQVGGAHQCICPGKN